MYAGIRDDEPRVVSDGGRPCSETEALQQISVRDICQITGEHKRTSPSLGPGCQVVKND